MSEYEVGRNVTRSLREFLKAETKGGLNKEWPRVTEGFCIKRENCFLTGDIKVPTAQR